MNNRQLATLAGIGLGLAAIGSSMFVVQQSERVALFQFGRLQGVDHAPGLHFKLPFVQTVTRFDGRTRTLKKQSENVLTHDQKNVRVDYFAKWKVVDTLAYYRATGSQPLSAENNLSSIVNSGLHDELSVLTLPQIISGSTDRIVAALLQRSAARAGAIGVELVDVRLTGVVLPDDVRGAYYERMRAERTRLAADLRAKGDEAAEKIRAEADREAEAATAGAYRDAEKMRGEGDAKAAEIYGRAYGQDPEFYSFYRSLSLYRDSFRGQQDVLVLEPKGELFRFFKQSGK
jgi:modulator of FtsH protease HflC